jgi:hypothetical protein
MDIPTDGYLALHFGREICGACGNAVHYIGSSAGSVRHCRGGELETLAVQGTHHHQRPPDSATPIKNANCARKTLDTFL